MLIAWKKRLTSCRHECQYCWAHHARGGKSAPNAIAEVREAIDFLRYYAAEARHTFGLLQQPLGPIVCISPWNFPLAIFIGQVAAALVAGNPVLAKPAEESPADRG